MTLLTHSLPTIIIFLAFQKLYQWKKWPVLNPLFWSILSIIALILIKVTDYETYRESTEVISFFLGPATVVLAVPMYRQRDLLKRYWKPIFMGVVSSVALSALTITLLAMAFQLSPAMWLSLLPKSITTPIGISLAEQIGGIPALTVVSIILTGIAGAMFSPQLIRLANIKHPVAMGIAIGSSSHVVGTTKAIELGEVEGAMSSLSIAIAGVLTYMLIPPYLMLFNSMIQ